MNNIRSFVVESADPSVTMGAQNADSRLQGRFARAALHELFVATPDDVAAATGFALLLSLRAAQGRPLVWIRDDRSVREWGRVSAAGLVALGADPDSITLVVARDTRGVLQAGADSVNCAAIGSVVIEPWGRAPELGLTESRRLAFAAARSGVLMLALRVGTDPVPSAAATRWRIAAAPSTALAANAPGQPAFDISLLRHRGGIAGFDARVEWDRDCRCFRDSPLSRGVSAVPAGATGDPRRRRAA